MYTQFPKIVINNNTMVCKIDDFISSIDTMNIIREVISNIDCNPIWQLGGIKPYDMWINTIARKATEGLRIDNPVRGSYSARRLYKEITIDSTTVDNIVKWLNSAYNIDISNYERVENSPVCPSCGKSYELMWNRVQGSDDGSLYRLIWGCPVYTSKCAEGKKIFRRSSPEVIHMDSIYKVFMHNFISDGIPIPQHHLRMPLTEWTLIRGGFCQTITSIIPSSNTKLEKSQPVTSNFTHQQINIIRSTFEKLGPCGFFEAYPNEKGFSWNDILSAAKILGLSG